MAFLVALPILATGCGGSSSDDSKGESTGAPTSPAATRPAAAGAGKTGYTTPMQIAQKIKKAGLGCASPKPAEVAGGKKVTCTVNGEQVNIEVYPSEQVFKQVMKAVCGTGVKIAAVSDNQRWDVTPDTARTAKRLQKVVGGRAEMLCAHI
ncbi:hypothetical protein [Actinoallomurus iriomotensis]|jgi:hypothetical protein|uniref:Uncharacterized protein n=1 Tax=Actinoallomurus iriomotensis TaxID=478107 RepID=A0A9W6S9A8_9ACTN|nr:hypothetical protein [Actinoallomurus iriomotensis]GLY89491.1 hypothetical protein Airi02_074200 [Actinoallomurus iriomotensis]